MHPSSQPSGGAAIGEGDAIDVIYGSANRDPAVFSDPESFRLDRPATEHVAFGYDIYYCLGAPLAKVEARIALNAMLDRLPASAGSPWHLPRRRHERLHDIADRKKLHRATTAICTALNVTGSHCPAALLSTPRDMHRATETVAARWACSASQ